MAGATFARSRTFVAGETLTATNLNGVETNILNNFTPAGMDDYSANATEMRVTTDPYPAGAESLATALQGELERIRYLIAQITGETYWYIDPDYAITALLPKAGGAMTGALNEAKGSDIASATTTDIGAATGNYVDVTGTVTITGLGTVQSGTRRIVRFTGALTLTHNATSLILPSGANITTAANDRAEFISLGSGNWICVNYERADGTALAGAITAATQAEQEAGSSTTVMTTPGRQHYHPSAAKAWVKFSGTGTPTISVASNVASITDNAVGDYTANLTIAFSSADFACIATPFKDTADNVRMTVTIIGQAAGSVRVQTFDSSDIVRDSDYIYIACFGDQ